MIWVKRQNAFLDKTAISFSGCSTNQQNLTQYLKLNLVNLTSNYTSGKKVLTYVYHKRQFFSPFFHTNENKLHNENCAIYSKSSRFSIRLKRILRRLWQNKVMRNEFIVHPLFRHKNLIRKQIVFGSTSNGTQTPETSVWEMRKVISQSWIVCCRSKLRFFLLSSFFSLVQRGFNYYKKN